VLETSGVSWRTLALAACWIAAAGWGIYYLIVLAGSSPAYVANAVAHFVIGYLLARAIIARPISMPAALLATFAAGAYVRLALAFGGPEQLFSPLGLIAAVALSDTSTPRNVAYSALAFVLGFIVLIWLVP
jgi:hypothetical protein